MSFVDGRNENALDRLKSSLTTHQAFLICDRALGPHFSFIPDCLAAYFSRPPKRDSILRRISMATRLLTQSDSQGDDSIALALSVAAVEAMLCRKGENFWPTCFPKTRHRCWSQILSTAPPPSSGVKISTAYDQTYCTEPDSQRPAQMRGVLACWRLLY